MSYLEKLKTMLNHCLRTISFGVKATSPYVNGAKKMKKEMTPIVTRIKKKFKKNVYTVGVISNGAPGISSSFSTLIDLQSLKITSQRPAVNKAAIK